MTEVGDPDLIPTWQKPRTFRRFARFNLRFFLVAVTLFCVYTAWHVQRTKSQKKAVDAFREYGGWPRYDYQVVDGKFDPEAKSFVPSWLLDRLGIDFFHSVVEMNCFFTDDYGKRKENSSKEPAPLEQLSGLPRLTSLYLHGTQATDESLVHVGKLRHLVNFFVWSAQEISDTGVAHLDGLKHLQKVHLTDAKITDESLRVFGKMQSLKRLTLQFNNFTDDGMRHLQSLQNLESLWVCQKQSCQEADRALEEHFTLSPRSANGITDDGLEFIAGCFPQLKELGVQYTHVTRAAVKTFEAKRPNCKIYHVD